MPFEIVRNDITAMAVDAIVNTANPKPVIGSGTDAAIHEKAGPLLLKARKFIGSMQTCEARITPGFRLPAKYVIHTVGPVWEDGYFHEEQLLRQCYDNVLKLAARHRITSIAFPLISTGNYGFPKKLALKIAIDSFSAFLMDHDMHIYLVVFSKDAYELSEKLVGDVKSYIDEKYAERIIGKEYGTAFPRRYDPQRRFFDLDEDKCIVSRDSFNVGFDEPDLSVRRKGALSDECITVESCEPGAFESAEEPEEEACYAAPKASANVPLRRRSSIDQKELEERLKKMDAGFSGRLLQLIDRSGQKDSVIYKKANIDRKLFSKIKNKAGYKPSKETAIAFAIALELNLEETKDLISRAGYALSGSSKFDIIIEYFIIHGHYDIYEINMMLFEFDQPLLGA